MVRGSRSVWEGRLAHHHLLSSSCGGTTVVMRNLLMQMYGRHGAAEDAYAMFSSMRGRDRFSWNFMMRAYARNGHTLEALHLFNQMPWEGFMPDTHIVSAVLLACSRGADVATGQHVHAGICHSDLESNLIVGNSLLSLYGIYGSLQDARQMFDKMQQRDTVTWTAMIAAYSRHGLSEDAFQLFGRMQLEGILGDKFTFTSILSACAHPVALPRGKHIHKLISNNGFESDVAVGNALLNMYVKCGSQEDAESMFRKIISRNEITWTIMINAYAQFGNTKAALELFHLMENVGLRPSKVTLISVLSSCVHKEALVEGKRLHSCITYRKVESDVIVETALVTMYGKCGDVEEARKVFDKMSFRNVFSWNAMITAYSHLKQHKGAQELFGQMLQEGAIPDKVTFIGVVSAFTSQMDLAEGKAMHSRIIGSGFESDISVANALLNMYGKCGRLEQAWIMWNSMLEWDRITLLCLLSACINPEALTVGKQIHTHILNCGFVSDVGLSNALMSMYSNCGSFKEACKVFLNTPERDCISWSIIIAANAQHGHGNEALHLFNEMQKQDFMADKVAFITVLSACASLAAGAEGKRVHALIARSNFEADIEVRNALIDMYSKCGELLEARGIFDKTAERDIVIWTSMLSACAHHGQNKDALDLFLQMQQEGMVANRAAFVNMLSACGGQATAEDLSLHARIVGSGFESDVVVGTALVKMYGKCGNLEDATRTFENISIQTLISCNAVIAVYAQHGQGNLALQLFGRMQRQGLMPDEVTLVCVLSACSHAGLIEEACYILVSMIRVYYLIPNLDHHNCIFDSLRRAGHVNMLGDLLINVPFQPSFVSWVTFLGGCQNCNDVELQENVTNHALELENELLFLVG